MSHADCGLKRKAKTPSLMEASLLLNINKLSLVQIVAFFREQEGHRFSWEPESNKRCFSSYFKNITDVIKHMTIDV